MDIVIDCRMIEHSGIGVYIKNIIKLISGSHSIKLLGNPEMLKYEFENILTIPFYADIYSINEQLEYNKVIPSCDLFWSPHYNVPLFGIKASKRIVTIHDVFHLAFFQQLNLKQKIYAQLVINRAISASDAIVTVSDFSKSEIIKFTNAKANKINVIYNGVKQTAITKDVNLVAAKYKLPPHYILYVGNVKPHKNLKALIDAYLKLPHDIQEKYKIVVAGKIDGFITGDESLVNFINNHPLLKQNVVFTGFIDEEDMDTIYANASLFILPSLYEGFGLPPLEAMLNGCPVLVSGQNSLPEVCGDAAGYFDPSDPEDIALEIKKALSDKTFRDDLILKGKERIKLFNWADCAAKHIALFNQAVK